MSDTFDIRAGERGVVRLFRIDLPEEAVARFSDNDTLTGRWPLKEALGVEDINERFVDIFAIRDLDDMGLTGYMTEGLGVSEDEIAPHLERLNALDGHVVVVLSGAFKGLAVTLLPRAPLRWVGTFFEDRPAVKFEKLPSDGSEPKPAEKKAPSNAAMSGRVATLALLVIFGITGLMIWIAA
ncbi:MAG: aspartate carbamoyltransferase catalytic subunit [Pseudomonadota bacterium]